MHPIELRTVMGWTYQELSEVLGVSLTAAKSWGYVPSSKHYKNPSIPVQILCDYIYQSYQLEENLGNLVTLLSPSKLVSFNQPTKLIKTKQTKLKNG